MVNRQVVVITGGASGIGLALSEVCLKRQKRLVMADVDGEKLAFEKKRLHEMGFRAVEYFQCDVAQYNSVERLAQFVFDQYGRIDYLFNNAGVSDSLLPLWETPIEQIENLFDVNVLGAVHGIKAFFPFLLQQTIPSHLINMASVYALCSGSKMAAYSMSKHAILALSESLYFDIKRLQKDISVSVVCPSFVRTKLLQNAIKTYHPFYEAVHQLIERGRPAADVAQAIMDDVEKKKFYILPDKEVKAYCEKRSQAIIEEAEPHQHSLETIIAALSRRTNS